MIIVDGKKVPCNNHGKCDNQGMCICDAGYYGEDCSHSCPGLTKDSDGNILECSGHGTCDQKTYQCQCKDNRYVGDDCSVCVVG